MSLIFALIACFSALLAVSSGAYEHLFKDVYPNSKSESDLRRHLFKNYDPLVRPVKDYQTQLNVSVALSPLNVRALDENRQLLLLESWIAMNWTDEYLRWDPSQHGNIKILRVPSSEVWRPDFAVYGSPDPSVMFPPPKTNVLVYNTGFVLWVPMFTMYSRCPILKPSKKIVTCNIKIGSWTFSGDLLDIQLKTDKVDTKDFVDMNPNWKLVEVSQDREDKYYPCCTEPYPSVNFNVTLRRRFPAEAGNSVIEDLSKADADVENMLYL